MPKLFATNFANVGYDAIEQEYNSPVLIMTYGFIDVSTPAGLKRLVGKVLPIIKSASPEDFLIISGSSVISVIISNYWLKYHGVVRLLTFNRRENGYVEVVLPNIELSPDDSTT